MHETRSPVRALAALLLLAWLLQGCGSAEPPAEPPAPPPPGDVAAREEVAPEPPEPAQSEAPTPATPPVTSGERESVEVVRLDFDERLADGKATILRMLITDGHLRLDGGLAGEEGYVLYDRNARVIYAVSDAARTIRVMPALEVEVPPPLPLELTVRARAEPGATAVGPRAGSLVEFLVNGRTCYSAVVVDGLLEPARRAESEYLEAQASRERAELARMPGGMLDACDLGRYVFAPARHLVDGYPVQVQDPAGYRRHLIGFDAAWRADAALFTLPEGYERVSPPPAG